MIYLNLTFLVSSICCIMTIWELESDGRFHTSSFAIQSACVFDKMKSAGEWYWLVWKIAPNDISRPAQRRWRRRWQLNLTIYQEILAQIKHQSKRAQCQLLCWIKSKQFFICPPCSPCSTFLSLTLASSALFHLAGCFFAQRKWNKIQSD